jgi:hypothetical protein
MISGFLTIDKPGGITSNRVVSEVKKATGIKKVGHAGTLDPMATGAVVTAIGPVTRLIKYVQDQEKEYLATALFGVATDTLDADGAVLTREPMPISPEEVVDAAVRFIGARSRSTNSRFSRSAHLHTPRSPFASYVARGHTSGPLPTISPRLSGGGPISPHYDGRGSGPSPSSSTDYPSMTSKIGPTSFWRLPMRWDGCPRSSWAKRRRVVSVTG